MTAKIYRSPLRVIAQRRARTRLVDTHRDDYNKFYREELTKLKEEQDGGTTHPESTTS